MIFLDSVRAPDNIEFYIWLVGILFGIVSFLIGWYMLDTKNMLKDVQTSVNTLLQRDAVKQERIDTMDKRILNIESKIFTVVYDKKKEQ